MGEIAEMMLNGDLDEETGEYIGPGQGFPRSPARAARHSASRRTTAVEIPYPTAAMTSQTDGKVVAAKALRWLWLAAQPGSGAYPGVQWDAAPGVFQRLQRRGLVTTFEPHNDAHKTRAVATSAGMSLLRQVPA